MVQQVQPRDNFNTTNLIQSPPSLGWLDSCGRLLLPPGQLSQAPTAGLSSGTANFAPTISQAPFPAVVLGARADLGSWYGAHGVTAWQRGQKFSESRVSSQPAQPDHSGQQTTDHRAVINPSWRLFMRGIDWFPLQLSFYCWNKKKKNPLIIWGFFSSPRVQDKLACLRKKMSIQEKMKNSDYSKHKFFPNDFPLFSKMLKES